MRGLRRVGRVGLAISVAVLALGLVLVLGSAAAAGDWSLARQPWIGLGLGLLVAGHAATALFAVLLVVVEPIGWWRLVAFPPALFVGAFWAFVLLVGVPTTGGPEFDVGTALYSEPPALVLLLVATLLVALPIPIGLARRPRPEAEEYD